jgi:hypothetical protein
VSSPATGGNRNRSRNRTPDKPACHPCAAIERERRRFPRLDRTFAPPSPG